MTLLSLILGLLTTAPQYITQIEALYEAAKADFTSTDQAQVDAALAAARAAMPAQEVQTDAALTAAEKQ